MRRWLFFILLAFLASPAAGQIERFEAFERRFERAAPAQRDRLATAFVERIRAQGGAPLRQADGSVLFLHLADRPGRTVRLRGDFAPSSYHAVGWAPDGLEMPPLAPESRLHVLRRRFEPDARLDYQIVVDGTASADPLNPRRRDSGIHGEVSELVMPGYREPDLLAALHRPPQGRMIVLDGLFANPRVRVYLPAGYDPSRRYPVLYTPDGAAWTDYLQLPQIMDQAIARRTAAPFIAVMVDAPQDRSRYYYFAADFLDYLDRVVRHVDANYPTVASREGRFHAGTSAGSRAALFAAFERPQLFGGIAMLSPSINGPPSFYAPVLSGERSLPAGTRVWIAAGSYEGAIHDDARLMEQVFRRQGLTVRSHFTREGHGFPTWRNQLADVLAFLFPPEGQALR